VAETDDVPVAGEMWHEEEKTARGRPRGITDPVLFGNRDYLVWLLENTWAEVGLNLLGVKNPSEVRHALREWEIYRDANPIVAALLRPTERALNGKRLRVLHRQRSQLIQSMLNVQERQKRCQERLEIAERVLAQELPEDQKNTLEEQLVKRAEALELAKAQFLAEQKRLKELDEEIKDGHAHIAQTELVRFRKSRRYTINPINTANALAGLPSIGYRQSIKRCRRRKAANAGGPPYQIFKVLLRIVNSPHRGKGLFQHAEQWLKKMRVTESNPNFHAVVELRWNAYFLKNAIEAVLKTKPSTTETPYKIATEYFKRLANRTALDLLLEEDLRIVP
jgi:hypothetical protein